MRFDVISLFPDMLNAYFSESILKRAQAASLIEIGLHDLRQFGVGKHRITDEPPVGGGGGMVLKPEPMFAAIEAMTPSVDSQTPIILLSPQGRPFTQRVAEELVQHDRLVFVCGRYEGFDERVRQHLVTDEISIGDYVLTGGELGAMVIVDAVSRLINGVLGDEQGAASDSHATTLLEGPHYTKPMLFRGWEVPALLRSGQGKKVAQWRREAALRRTWERRPDMLISAELTPNDKKYLLKLALEEANRQT